MRLTNQFIPSALDAIPKTSQELGNCPMGQRDTLWKERLYWKKGFIERKILFKEMLYWKKGFIEKRLYWKKGFFEIDPLLK